ncbi:MAG: hypothetical protein QOJ27_167 [Sphingomonadales bacterium]|nr:hypothetical protein [Sphingomonadales bacterium]
MIGARRLGLFGALVLWVKPELERGKWEQADSPQPETIMGAGVATGPHLSQP